MEDFETDIFTLNLKLEHFKSKLSIDNDDVKGTRLGENVGVGLRSYLRSHFITFCQRHAATAPPVSLYT